jgi:CubicO group peptidase (beta-lactamase class C family)
MNLRLAVVALAVLALALVGWPSFPSSAATADATAAGLVGLWEASRRFGPEVRGRVTVERRDDAWSVEIAGWRVPAQVTDGFLIAEVVGGGSLRVRPPAGEEILTGLWIQPRSVVHGARFASPVTLRPAAGGRWRGEVVPFEDRFTLHLPVSLREDGSLGTFLRNPERNQGIFWQLDRLELHDGVVDLISKRGDDEQVLAQATYRPDDDRLSVYLGGRGGTYDFERRPAGEPSSFFPRGRHPTGGYEYRQPPALDDGWPVGSLEDVGISPAPIRHLIEEHFSSPPTSVRDVYPHGLLIARHGRLVVEEYFHGFHRERPHDTRSASKSLTAVLAGAAIEAGLPLAPATSVYATLRPGVDPSATDPRREGMQLEHLLTMSSGLACNDSDPASPGNEEIMQEQSEQPDWYAFALDLPMAADPGEVAHYCSATAHLAGAVIAEAAGEPLPELFQRLVAEPLQLGLYHLPLTPTGEVYMGGGVRWLPRDFLKLGQLMLDGGSWNGRRVVSREWAARSIAPLRELRDRGYGYLWWSVEYPYHGRSVRAFFAGGNGGQVVIGVPELDLLVAFFAGNYSDRTLFRYQEEFFPEYILPAVEEG